MKKKPARAKSFFWLFLLLALLGGVLFLGTAKPPYAAREITVDAVRE